MADEKNIENKDENVIEVEEVEKIDVEEKVADEKVEADESEAKTDSVDYEVYGNEVKDEAKKAADRILGDLFENIKSKQSEFNKTVEELRTNKPAFDLYVTEEDLVAKIDLPRVAKDDVSLKISTESIEVDAIFPEDIPEDVKLIKSTRCSGLTKTVIPLPEEVAINEVTAEFEDSVLTITVPKIKGRKVDVEIM